ncbi:hypothetical protein O3P69_018578 [Scylla paramamosain]|uniref:Uncharacterized protein n=1 Tax=Scylla paramamosain TaxID=85552 RepID=A0AAW0T217_SCYPA
MTPQRQPPLWKAVCYFNLEYQGVYVTQSIISVGSEINYLQVVIREDSIPIWGQCHRRLGGGGTGGGNVILYDSTGGTACIRCFHLEFRSRHILEVHNEGLNKCYTTEEAALHTCPTKAHIKERKTREIMLYKTGTLEGETLDAVYCPLNGRYKFTYNINDGRESAMECPQPTSSIANCPTGNSFAVQFHRCTFADFSKRYECLGDWEGSDGQRYLALHDPAAVATPADAATTTDDPPQARFRCAMYKVDESGVVYLTLSSDSTCINKLHSAWEGFETLVLTPIPQDDPAPEVSAARCSFPPWAQGRWENLHVEGNKATYTDLKAYKTVTLYCLEQELAGLVPVYTQTQCGEEGFTCLAMQERSSNVMEFQISESEVFVLMLTTRTKLGYAPHPASLTWDSWVTQGRVDRFRQSPCPVAGEYTGVIPDNSMLCAKLYSDCNNPEIMFYTVFFCSNRSDVIEEREYRCLGQWVEGDVTYTYTERRDQATYECFAGEVVDDDEIFIMEAGVNCQRGLEALSYGMKLVKQAPCLNDPGLGGRAKPQPAPRPPWWTTTRYPSGKKANTPTPTGSGKEGDGGGASGVTPTNFLPLFLIFVTLHWCWV